VALSVIVLATAALITWQQAWPAVGRFLVNLDVLAASGLVALLAAVVAAGGYLRSGESPSEPSTSVGNTSGRDPVTDRGHWTRARKA
jgi:hypothetical protein